MSLASKLVEIRTAFGPIEKTGTNKGVGEGYKFVEASHIASRFLELCGQYGVVMTCRQSDIRDIRSTPSGKQTVFTLWTAWHITSATDPGEVIIVESFGQGADNGDKALPKAQTNAMKYAILLLLQRAGDDPEADGKTDQIEAGQRVAAAEERQAQRRASRRQARPGSAPAPDAFPDETAPAKELPEPVVAPSVPQPAPVPQPVEQPARAERTPHLATDAKKRALRAKAHEVGLDDARLKAMATFLVGDKSSKEWTDREADKIIANLDKPSVVEMFHDAVAVGEAVQA